MVWKDSFVGSTDGSTHAKLIELMPHTTFVFAQEWMAHARLFTLMTDRSIARMEEMLEWFWTEHDSAWHATLETMRTELDAARNLLMEQPRIQIVSLSPETRDTNIIFELYGASDAPVRVTDRVTLLPVAEGAAGKFVIRDTVFSATPIELFDHCTVPHLNWSVRCWLPNLSCVVDDE